MEPNRFYQTPPEDRMNFPRDASCLVCGERDTGRGFICSTCYLGRYGMTHPRWLDLAYVEEMRRQERRLDQQAAYKRRAAERKESA